MQKIKPVLPSLREKKRYLAFEVISKSRLKSYDSLEKSIFDSLTQLIGEMGMAQAGIIMLKDKYNADKQRGLLRVSTKSLNQVRQALTFVQNIENQPVIVHTVGVSGILKKAVSNYMK